MPRDILGGFGPESSQPQAGAARKGGVTTSKDVMNYSAPVGPKGINESQSPGLHGHNSGNKSKASGTSLGEGAGGFTNHGCCGSQGKY